MLRFILGGVLAAVAGAAAAQSYPAKPIRFIVPFPPGGGTDIVARTVAGKLTELVTSDKRPFRSLAEVVAAAKAKPGQLSYASPGNGTVAHLTAELFQRAAGIQLSHIPYKGASQAMTDLMGGQVDLYLSSVPSAIAQIKGGKLRALAVTGAKRSAELREVPAVAESGYKGFDVTTWYGLLFPAGTPEPVVKLMNGEVNRVLKLADVRARLAAEGGDVLGGTPGEFAAVLKADLARWGEIVKQSGAKVD